MTGPAMLSRLARAVHLDAERLNAHHWRVWGGAAEHVVDADRGTCDCPDFRLRGRVCKHILAARLRSGDVELLNALRDLVPMPRRTWRRVAP